MGKRAPMPAVDEFNSGRVAGFKYPECAPEAKERAMGCYPTRTPQACDPFALGKLGRSVGSTLRRGLTHFFRLNPRVFLVAARNALVATGLREK